MTHKCYAPGAAATVPDHLLMCRGDWYRVPSKLRAAVLEAYASGRGVGSLELIQAQRNAISALRDRYGEAASCARQR